jgi:predicted DNA-binding ArsR family transcriptional regulator
MISSIWPMPQNLKVPKNENSNSVKAIQSNHDSSISNNNDIEDFITSKQEFIINSSLDPKIKNDLKVALDDLGEFINQNQLKNANVQVGFAIDHLSELVSVQKHFEKQFNYNPEGQIPFPKEQAIGSVDLDDPF